MIGQKKQRADDTIADIQKRFGQDAIGLIHKKPPSSLLSTSLASPKELLGGWVPRGALTEFVGSLTSGLTTIALHVIAAAQQAHDLALFFDLASVFDADYAAQCGVRFDDLYVVQQTFDVALEMLFDAIATGIPGVVVFNTFPALTPGTRQQLAATLKRLYGKLEDSRCALLVLASHQPDGVSHRADVRLQIERVAWVYDRQDVVGYKSRVTVLKHPSVTIGQSVQFYILVDAEDGA
jgi:recombination protein RecA